MIDLMGSVKIELRDNVAMHAWTDRIRGEELAPGDAKGAGEYVRWVRIQRVSGLPRLRRTPVQFPRFVVTVGGTTPEDAMAGYGLVTDVLHNLHARLRANGIGIHLSFEDGAPDPELDPDTKQPICTSIYQLIAPTQVVPV